ncbi:hypothetical protein PC116_g34542, partial [Phytophthora cactorum]
INNAIFQAKDHAPYTEDQLHSVLLNPDARVAENGKTAELIYPADFAQRAAKPHIMKARSTKEMVESLAQSLQTGKNNKVGVDVEDIAAVNIDNPTFIERNFTEKEIAYCQKTPSPQSSFAGRWSAKEAVFKSLGVQGKGAGAPLKDIEILPNETGAPIVTVSRLLDSHRYQDAN